ncbi:MAG: glycine cleavage system protein GcvH [Myxococcales bacterium]|nr:glycine cleavage system protein GcvH [Myxococcales bacterium]
MSFPADLRYTKDHEWARLEADGTITVGITDHAQDALGDVVYVELPEAGRALEAGETFGVVESVKSVSDLYAPCAGEVVESNGLLQDAPETINGDAYGKGWLVKLKVEDAGVLDTLLDAKAYQALVEAEAG